MLNSKGIISEISEVRELDYYLLDEYLNRGWEICGSRSTIVRGRVIVQRRWEVPGFVQFILNRIRDNISKYDIGKFNKQNEEIEQDLLRFKRDYITFNSTIDEYKDIQQKTNMLDDRLELFRDIKWFIHKFLYEIEGSTYFTNIPELINRFSKYF